MRPFSFDRQTGVLVISVQKVTLSKSLIRFRNLQKSDLTSLISRRSPLFTACGEIGWPQPGAIMALWDYRYLRAEEFAEALSALEIEHILRWSL